MTSNTHRSHQSAESQHTLPFTPSKNASMPMRHWYTCTKEEATTDTSEPSSRQPTTLLSAQYFSSYPPTQDTQKQYQPTHHLRQETFSKEATSLTPKSSKPTTPFIEPSNNRSSRHLTVYTYKDWKMMW
jgi:hypothetical protein